MSKNYNSSNFEKVSSQISETAFEICFFCSNNKSAIEFSFKCISTGGIFSSNNSDGVVFSAFESFNNVLSLTQVLQCSISERYGNEISAFSANLSCVKCKFFLKILMFCESIFLNDKSAFSYNIENFLVKKGLYHAGKNKLLHEDFDENFVKKRKNVVTFDEKLIGLSDGSVFSREELSYKIPLDYMLVYGYKKQTLSYLLNVYNFDYLIIDGSMPCYLALRLIDEAAALGIKYHNIREDGAFLMK